MLRFIVIGLVLMGGCNSNAQQNPQQKAKEALEFCRKNKMDTTMCFLIDMSIHSGKFRFAVWDYALNKVVERGLCTHGVCDNFNSDHKTKFSNQPDSHCSSLGKYKVGKRSYSNWGIKIHYKLHGLETTNNNSYKRIVVLHSWNAVVHDEIYPWSAPLSWGCPAVSNDFMRMLDKQLKGTKRPVLLWIYL